MELLDLLRGDHQNLVDALSFMVDEDDCNTLRALKKLFKDGSTPLGIPLTQARMKFQLVNQALLCVTARSTFEAHCKSFLDSAQETA